MSPVNIATQKQKLHYGCFHGKYIQFSQDILLVYNPSNSISIDT